MKERERERERCTEKGEALGERAIERARQKLFPIIFSLYIIERVHSRAFLERERKMSKPTHFPTSKSKTKRRNDTC